MAIKEVVELKDLLTPDAAANTIGGLWVQWKAARAPWEERTSEVSRYVFSTDTTTTTNSSLPWKNKTVTPKVCQIRDNLHANYMAALFPNEDWFNWLALDEDAALKQKADLIKSYMKNKLFQSRFRQEISRLVLDYIDYGNAFAEVEFVNEYHETDGTQVLVYSGPRVSRISPHDIVFDLKARSFRDAPKIVRSIYTMGQLVAMADSQPDSADMATAAIQKAKELRKQLAMIAPDKFKDGGFMIDGFGSILQYYQSGMCEILTYEGDFFDALTGTLYKNYKITVLDRAYVLTMEPNKSWLGTSNKVHVGWRLRPDSLLAMGPLDNLIGLQYRVDHLENLRADAFDLIAFPPLKIRGQVEDFEWGPNERIYMDEDADVNPLSPDTTVLSADLQIQNLLNLMEEMAGAPKQAMGIRTPGEKTAYEVQALDNAAGRIFQNKVTHFEENFIEEILNQMLECGRRNLSTAEQIAVLDADHGVLEFIMVTPEDIKAKGKLVPMGARHFAKQAQVVQNLTNLANSAIYQDTEVKVHISGLRMAQLLAENLNVTHPGLVEENIRIYENAETLRTQNVISGQVADEAGADSEVLADEMGMTGPEMPTDEGV